MRREIISLSNVGRRTLDHDAEFAACVQSSRRVAAQLRALRERRRNSFAN
jgi:hypothetical protein